MKTTKSLFGILTITTALAVQVHAQTFLTNGLVAYYPFNGNANDAVGANNGTVSGATLTADRFGQPNQGYTFDGVSSKIVANNAPQLAFDPQTSLGVFAWIKFSGNVPGFEGIVSKMLSDIDTNPTSGFQIGIINNTLEAQIGSPSAVIFHGTTVLNDGRWHAIGLVLQRTNSTAQLFVDGNLDATITDPKLLEDLSCTNFLFFGVERNLSRFFPGSIDDVRIYNRALSASEVQQLYVYESQARTILPNGLVAYYPFNGNANDASGSGNNGVVSGAALSTDRFGATNSAFSFNGQNAQITVSDNAALRGLTSNYTFNAWARWASNPSFDSAILLKSVGPANNAKWIFWRKAQDNSLGIGVHLNRPLSDGAFWWNYDYPFATNRWYMLTFSSSGTNCLIAVDGVVQSVQSGNLTLPDTSGVAMSIGGSEAGANLWFNGSLDDIRVYNRALSVSEVQQLYAIESGPSVDLIKAVKPSFSYLTLGTNYQLQVSGDMNTWTNQGPVFTATNTSMVYPQYWDVDDWDELFFRLQVAP